MKPGAELNRNAACVSVVQRTATPRMNKQAFIHYPDRDEMALLATDGGRRKTQTIAVL